MENLNVVANFRNSACSGKQPFLPPRSPFPSVSPAHSDFGSKPCPVTKGIPKSREGLNRHQRTSSESFLFEEQPSWLDDLLNEPETPVRRGGHRRSSSDSFAYSNMSTIAGNIESPPWGGYQGLDHGESMQYPSYYTEGNSFGRPQDKVWESGLNTMNYPSNVPPGRDMSSQSPGPSDAVRDSDPAMSTGSKNNDREESAFQDPKQLEKREETNSRNSQSEADPKRAKQKFAQRSRVRKLQYIAELERNVQALQVEGAEVCAELGFLDQQNLILNLENKALKQRLDSLAQEQFIKHLQQETLEREINRLQGLYLQQQHQQQQQHQRQHQHQHQQPQQPIPTHGRTSSRDLDSQFANLSLRHKAANPGWDPVTGTLRI